jgi:chaperone modulatory protein CbpM
MQTEYLIAIDEFCASHNIEISFISSLQKSGLIEVITIKESEFIDADQLRQLEKMVRFYYEFDINLEGIETINHLLQQLKKLQEENINLRNKLRLYELDNK